MLDALIRRTASLLSPTRPRSELDRLVDAAGRAHLAARRSLAAAVSEEARETTRRAAFVAKVGDLETRAVAALVGGREDLAARAAETIAALETEIAASDASAVRYGARVAATRRVVEAERRRFADVERGRRLARVGAALDGALLEIATGDGLTPLARAEAALARVEAEQAEADAMRLASAPEALVSEDVTNDLAEAGFGRPTHIRAADVMARLRAQADPPLRISRS